MNIWRWITAKVLGRNGRLLALGRLLQEGYGYLNAEEYDKARLTFSRLLDRRDDLKALSQWADPKDIELLDCVLTSLETTWLMTERYDEAIAFFSEYLGRYPNDSAAYCASRRGAMVLRAA